MRKITYHVVILNMLVLLISSINATRPASWNQIVLGVFNHTTDDFTRNASGQEKYDNFKQNLVDNNISMLQHTQRDIFGYNGHATEPLYRLFITEIEEKPYTVFIQTSHPQDIEWINVQIEETTKRDGLTKGQDAIILVANQFPYFLEDSIQHWILWSNSVIPLAKCLQIITSLTNSAFESIAYENTIRVKSIPEVYHIQIMFHKLTQPIKSDAIQNKKHPRRHSELLSNKNLQKHPQ